MALALMPLAAAGAQERASAQDQFALEQLALSAHVMREDPAKRTEVFARIAIEPRLHAVQEITFAWRPSHPPSRTVQESRALAAMLGSGIVLDTADSCDDVSCRIGSHRGVLVFTPATITGDMATIDLHSHRWFDRAPGRPRAMASSIERFTFSRRAGAWQLLRRQTLLIS